VKTGYLRVKLIATSDTGCQENNIDCCQRCSLNTIQEEIIVFDMKAAPVAIANERLCRAVNAGREGPPAVCDLLSRGSH
jgi:hypothetical protein